MIELDEASRAQAKAADPTASTWLGANAGSGKTRVLTERVARLLLRGVPPQRILCLTYTKAAASEIQNRLFKRLGGWAMLDDKALQRSLAALGTSDDTGLDRARTLFARAIETPGGLKIQTIHSFCAALLRRFPLEAGVSPQFRELDDRDQLRVIDDVLDALASDAPDVLRELAVQYSGETFSELALEVAGASDEFLTADLPSVADVFGVEPHLTLEDVHAAALEPGDLDFLASLVDLLRGSAKPTDHKLADFLSALKSLDIPEQLDGLASALLTGASAAEPFSAKIGKIPTKGLREGAFAPHVTGFDDIMRRVEHAHRLRLNLEAATRTAALRRFADIFLPAYEARKRDLGVLDFDDLIAKTRALLHNVDMTWILYRLDGGIDHVLVDEAQDTSPAQWSVIEALTAELTAGHGAREDVARTIFVVGDKKQSIYSFQGADARGFDLMRDRFGERLRGGAGLRTEALTFSFRSAPAILASVDSVFQGTAAAGLDQDLEHRPFYAEMPGRVDLWDLEEPEPGDEDPPWHDPVDRPARHSPRLRLADKVARHIGEMLENGTIQGENGTPRRITGGDILILVRGRGELFDAIIRACKGAGLPIAGADRLRVNAELAVRDLLALLSFLVLPDDDLSLATVLRSPLFGWSEADLYGLAQPRGDGVGLWQALRGAREDHPGTFERLTELRRRADFFRPYELLEYVLTCFGGRRAMLERLGPEAEDGIDELLNQALSYEQSEVPSLTGFLAFAHADDITIKRQIESSGDLIRVMTVHGAKGLEAPVVILPDTIHGGNHLRNTFLSSSGTGPVWNVGSDRAPKALRALKSAAKEAAAEEDNRLLYVAMTRAANWLVVAGARGERAVKDSWWSKIEAGMTTTGARRIERGDSGFLRLETGIWPDAPERKDTDSETVSPARPGVGLSSDAAPPSNSRRLVTPSALGGDKVLPFEADTVAPEDAKARGTQVHRLLETLPALPRDSWSAAAARLLDLSPDDTAPLLAEASAVIEAAPDVFAPEALAEVDLTAGLPGTNSVIVGAVDRLLPGDKTVRLVDFKTNAEVPHSPEVVPDGLLRQMGAYLIAAEQVWPDREIVLEILWTRTLTRMVLPHAIVRAAFGKHTIS